MDKGFGEEGPGRNAQKFIADAINRGYQYQDAIVTANTTSRSEIMVIMVKY